MRFAPSRECTVVAGATLCLAVVATAGLTAQSTASFEPPSTRDNPFALTIESIMRGPELIGQSPQRVQWSDDGEWVFFRWLPGGEDWHADRALYRVRAGGGEPERVDDDEADALAPLLGFGDVSPDRKWRAVSAEGDLWIIERETSEVRRLTHTTEAETVHSFSADGASIFFRREQNLFAFDVADGAIRQLTRIAGPDEPDDPDPEGHKAFLETQQRELFEHVRVGEMREERREARNDRREAREPKTLHLPNGERAASLTPDPTGRFVAVTAVKGGRTGETTDIPRWITQSGYTENTEMRAKVGDEQSESRLALVETATGEVTWLDLTGTPEHAAGDEDAENRDEDRSNEDRSNEDEGGGDTGTEDEGNTDGDAADGGATLAIASFAGWNDTGTHGLAVAIDSDNKTWRLYALEAGTGELTLLAEHYDEAWVGGPCLGFGGGGCTGWLPSSGSGSTPRAFYVSEETGFAHLYAIDADGSDKRVLTSGDWEVRGVRIPEGWDSFLLHTGEISAFDRHPWRMSFDGSERTQLLEGDGWYDVTPSPEGDRLAVIHSNSDGPPELYLADARSGAHLDRVTESPTEEWRAFDWRLPEIIHFEARDGVAVPAKIYRPSDFGVASNGAGVVFVHGAGYLQNVHNGWSNYYREYMFHHFLAAQGYTVLDIDYRGSAGYGRDWRTAIYRHMGGWDLSDQVDGAAYLVEEEGVDADRLGIYGGSYGGFITLMALFTEPEIFEAGAALRSVTDWAHYNHSYTSRILNLPQDDEEAYRQSSPIYFAEGLKGDLLIAHGMFDTNVHYSDVVRLAQRLIELGKENWEMAVYPVENHGFAEPSSWTDEYRRIYELFERVIGNKMHPSMSTGEGG